MFPKVAQLENCIAADCKHLNWNIVTNLTARGQTLGRFGLPGPDCRPRRLEGYGNAQSAFVVTLFGAEGQIDEFLGSFRFSRCQRQGVSRPAILLTATEVAREDCSDSRNANKYRAAGRRRRWRFDAFLKGDGCAGWTGPRPLSLQRVLATLYGGDRRVWLGSWGKCRALGAAAWLRPRRAMAACRPNSISVRGRRARVESVAHHFLAGRASVGHAVRCLRHCHWRTAPCFDAI